MLVACGGESEPRRDAADTVAPVGAGTQRLLTEERLARLDQWIDEMLVRGSEVPASIEDIEPPPDQASLYVPFERYRRDGWGRSIHYDYRGEDRSYELRSSGEDGQLGTPDDVTLRSAVPPR